MNDHNLDDLIIDNIDPKNSKTKSFLTIIALAIVVLIVAIILTKIILKDPNEGLVLEEDNTELISPDLTLQPTHINEPKEEKVEHIKDTLALNKKTSTTPKPVEVRKQQAVQITNEYSQEVKEADKKKANLAHIEETRVKKLVAQKKVNVEKHAQQEKTLQRKPKQVVTSTTSNTGFFIQVGSFTKTPSSRFLSVIKNSGFNYQITPASSAGTKKLLIGPYHSRPEATTALVRVKDRINKGAFIVKK